MKLQRPVTSSHRALLALGAVVVLGFAPDATACTDCAGFVALEADGDPVLVVARGASAGAAGDLYGDVAEEWVAALIDGGIVVRSGDDGSQGTLPDLEARALAVGGGLLFAALDDGILAMDLAADTSEYIAAISATALAAADFDRDGAVEVAAALEDGYVLLFDLDTGNVFPLEVAPSVALAGADFLGLGRAQLALATAGGALEVVDLVGEDPGALCYLGAVAGSPRGFSALPSGAIATLDAAGEFAALDPRTCEVFAVDLDALDVTYESVFTSARVATQVPTGGQLPGDCNQDSSLDLSDAICLLGHLFLGSPARLPCGGGSLADAANLALLEANGDASVDLSDSVYLLTFLFLGGEPPVNGTACRVIAECPERCTP